MDNLRQQWAELDYYRFVHPIGALLGLRGEPSDTSMFQLRVEYLPGVQDNVQRLREHVVVIGESDAIALLGAVAQQAVDGQRSTLVERYYK